MVSRQTNQSVNNEQKQRKLQTEKHPHKILHKKDFFSPFQCLSIFLSNCWTAIFNHIENKTNTNMCLKIYYK